MPRPAQLLPGETVVFAEVSNFTQLTEQFKKTNYYKLYKDPAMAPFIEDVKAKLAEEIKKSDDELVQAVLAMDAMPSGRVAVALLPGPGQGFSEPHVVMIIEWGQAKAKVQETLDKVLAGAAEEGVRKKMEEYRGVSIIAAVHESEPDSAPSYCFIDDCLIGSTNTDLVKSVIARIQGTGGAALADDADYNTAIKAVGPAHDIDLYVNLKRLKDLIIAEAPPGQVGPLVTNLGLDNVISFSFAAGVARDGGSDSSGKALLRIDGEKKGVCKMLEFGSSALRVPKFAPAEFFSATYVNFNFKEAFDALGRIVTAISPQMAAILYMPLVPPSPDGQPGLTLKADIIDNLGSQLLSFRSLDKSASDSAGPKVETVVAIAANNRAALEGSLSRLHGLFSQGKSDASHPLLGHTIYTIDLATFLPFMSADGPSVQGLAEPPQAPVGMLPKLAFTVTDTHVIMGLEAAVEGAVRKLSTDASELPSWFRKAKAAIPDVVGLADLQDDAAAAQVLWKTLRQAAEEAGKSKGESDRSIKVGVGSSGLMFSQTGVDFVNPGLLPDFEVVRKYFGISAAYGIARQDGFFFEFKYLSDSN
ncbi:MAG TPA: DUF3352 domain-containing protein [Sedimentisphaerales bacterium]|nr:DUF3352 domain-containing protein [Sedimentisphaerales bacterium]